jgi:hypothetical protein
VTDHDASSGDPPQVISMQAPSWRTPASEYQQTIPRALQSQGDPASSANPGQYGGGGGGLPLTVHTPDPAQTQDT